MAFTPRNDWKTGDEYPASRVIELEKAVAAAAPADSIPQETPNGSPELLAEGTDTTPRAWSAKDLSEFIATIAGT